MNKKIFAPKDPYPEPRFPWWKWVIKIWNLFKKKKNNEKNDKPIIHWVQSKEL